MCSTSRTKVDGLVSISSPIWLQEKKANYAFLLKHFIKYSQRGKRPKYDFPSWRYEQVSLKNIADLVNLIKVCKRVLSKVDVPALVVQGEEDHTVEPRSARYIFNGLGSSDKELFITGGEHMLLLTPGQKDICIRVCDFIRIRTGGTTHARN